MIATRLPASLALIALSALSACGDTGATELAERSEAVPAASSEHGEAQDDMAATGHEPAPTADEPAPILGSVSLVDRVPAVTGSARPPQPGERYDLVLHDKVSDTVVEFVADDEHLAIGHGHPAITGLVWGVSGVIKREPDNFNIQWSRANARARNDMARRLAPEHAEATHEETSGPNELRSSVTRISTDTVLPACHAPLVQVSLATGAMCVLVVPD